MRHSTIRNFRSGAMLWAVDGATRTHREMSLKESFFHYNFMETRMGIIRLTASVLLLFGCLSPGLFASGFENTGIGTKARGMGGAFRAIADDWTAASTCRPAKTREA